MITPNDFINQRIEIIKNNMLPLKLKSAAKVVLHAIPMSMSRHFDINEERNKDYSMMRRLYVDAEKGMSYKYAGLMESSDNSLIVGVKDETSTENIAEVTLTMFDNASLEYVNSWVLRDYGARKQYPYITYGNLIPAYEVYNLIYVQILWTLTHFQRLEINDDFLFKVTIIGAKHHSIVTDLKDPVLSQMAVDARPKFNIELYSFPDIIFNYNPLRMDSQNDFDITWSQMKREIDGKIKDFWKIERESFTDWMGNQKFNYSLNEFLKILRSK